jgi:hypothetical protein
MPINAVNLTGNVYPAGPKGDTGPANTLEIGTVEKGENASASITGEAPNQTLNLILPKGDKGEKGDTGETNSLSIGTVEKGTVPSATITGQAPNQILNLVLPKGDTGEKGEVGPRGEQGIQGNPGPINSIKIGRVEKGEEASVTIVGESPNQILNFVLPIGPKGNTGEKGDQGPKGEQGIQGETGATTSLSIGRVSSGEEASATIIGEAPDQILNLVLPKGDKGEKGNVGPQGEQGIQGNPGPANSLTVGTVEKGAVPSATITGEAPNQVLNLVLPTGETAEIEAIKQKQTTQSENIEKNAEGIAQNKKDVDEELTKIKKENSLLKSQIPEGHASGNSIHLEDSSNMDFECKLRSESRQETTEGYNLLNVENDFKVTNLEANKVVEINLKADVTYTIKCDKIETDNTELKSCLFRFQHDSADVANPYARIPITTKTTTYTPPEDINSVRIYSGTSHNESATTNTTFKNLMIYEGTENKPYELYTGENPSPSPEYSSKIKNVGDNINILNKEVVDASNNLRGNALDTGRRLIANKDGNYTYGAFKIGGRELLGKTLGIHADIETTGGNPRISIFAGNSSSLTKSLLQVALSASGTGYVTIPSSLNSELDTISAVLYVTTDARVVAGTYVDYTNLKVQVGSKKVVYSAYNCGSLGVTISNKNLYKIEKVINDTNYSKIIYKDENGNVSFSTGGIPLIIAPTKIKEKTEYTYILKCQSNVTTENNINFTGIYEDGTSKLLSANKKKDTNEFIVKFKTDKEKTLAYVTQQYTNSSRTTIITKGTMILEGDYLNLEETYEIHQEQEILFPLVEGQKLYEGSYLAKEIHNKRAQDILTGEESLKNYHSDTSNGFVGFSFIISNKHKKNADFLCTHLTKNSDNVYHNRGLGGWLPDEDRWCYICVPISILKDVSTPEKQIESMQEYLKEQYNAGTPMIFEYELATEEIIPYTPEQQAVIDKILYTYKNVTNISVDNELATLDITYKKDIETMFNNQAKEYNERLSNIESLLNTTSTSALLLDNLESDLEKEV